MLTPLFFDFTNKAKSYLGTRDSNVVRMQDYINYKHEKIQCRTKTQLRQRINSKGVQSNVKNYMNEFQQCLLTYQYKKNENC